MKKIIIFKVLCLLIFFITDSALADDTDILGEIKLNVKPNVVMILDNSFSMTKTIEGPVGSYNKDTEYYNIAFLDKGGNRQDGIYYFDKDKIYSAVVPGIKVINSNGLMLFPVVPAMWMALVNKQSPEEIDDTSLKNDIQTNGFAERKEKILGVDVTYYYYHGNYLNWFYETRLNLARRTIEKLMKDKFDDFNFALMSFNELQDGGHFDMKVGDCTNSACAVTKLKSIGQCLTPHTPLAESLAESARYFLGDEGRFTHEDYTSPIKYWCQKNYVVILSDGSSVLDLDWTFWWPWSPDRMKDRGVILNYLDDVAAYMYENDMMPSLGEPGTEKEKQNVRTYTVGFRIDNLLDKITERVNILKSTASRGGGRYIEMNDPLELNDEFEIIMNNILKVSSSFGGVSAPVSPDDRSYTGNYAYMSMFKSVSDEGRRIGNLKKYSISDTGLISNKDEWSGSDSPELEAGGVRSKMLEMKVDDRKIYTTKNSSSSIIEFKTKSFGSDELVKYNLDDSIISNIRAGGQAVDGKPGIYVLGDIIHSVPLIYRNVGKGSSASIFAGANDGMMHCFDESTGNEKWAFIPESQLSRLKKLVYPGNKSDAAPYYFIDGGKTIYDADAKKILIFGERRGGKSYYGLDITNSDSPKLEYTVSLSDGFGQSWSTPRVVSVINGGESKEVFWIGGGYDAANQDKYNKDDSSVKPAETDSLGKGVYAIDANNGNILITPDNSGINNCIIDPVSFSPGYSGGSDTGHVKEESHSRLYACDMAGNLWGYRQDADNVTVVEDTSTHQPGERTDSWKKYQIFSSSVQRKVFHRPEVVLEIFSKKTVDQATGEIKFDRYNGEYIYFGTGDREHPAAKPANNIPESQNRFYALKNFWNTETSANESELVDATVYPFDASVLVDNRGWYLRLENPGEKVVSYPVAYRGMIFFTTYTPADESGQENPNDPCEGCNKLGKARLYILNYKTGEPVLNLSAKGLNSNNEETDNPAEIKKLCKADRVLEIGEGMPGSPSLLFPKNGGSKIMVGVGDKIYTYDLDVRDMTFYYWREAY